MPLGTVPADFVDASTWWQNDTEEAIACPIGQSGARDVALLRFDSETNSGGLMVGRPGSGKSTLFHTLLASACTLYPPSELELYLIDFKEGVEFKPYADHKLPHARCVAIESDREFGLSVLESVVAELKRRAELMRRSGTPGADLAALRRHLGEAVPRVLVVFDEFHVLFSQDDKVGVAAAEHLETIIRQGRSFGIHVLLGSQSIAGLDALGRHVLPLLPIRILLPSSADESQLVLGDRNDAWRHLEHGGEAILNAAGGSVEANVPFQVAYEDPRDRQARLAELRSLADSRGVTRTPTVFEGHLAATLSDHSFDGFDFEDGARNLLLGTPLSLAPPVALELRREAGANVLIVAKPSHSAALGFLLTSLASILMWQEQIVPIVADFTSVDDGLEDHLTPLLAVGNVTLRRGKRIPSALCDLAIEVTRRLDTDDYRSPTQILHLHGIHRARDLDAGQLSGYDSETVADMATDLQTILRDGPEVGVHTIAWADSVASLRRRLPDAALREFGWRLVAHMNRDDSNDLIGSDVAMACHDHQVVVYNDDAGTVTRVTAYAPPSADWIQDFLTSHKDKVVS